MTLGPSRVKSLGFRLMGELDRRGGVGSEGGRSGVG
jgi:hypothetical protein